MRTLTYKLKRLAYPQKDTSCLVVAATQSRLDVMTR